MFPERGNSFFSVFIALFTLIPGFAILAPAAHAGMVETYGIGAKATALGGAVAATADDPFAIYYNPAGITQAETFTAAGSIKVLMPEVESRNYTVKGGAAAIPSTPAYPHLQKAGNMGDDTDYMIAPALGAIAPVSERLSLGVAAYVPWGMQIDWENDPARNPGAYNSTYAYFYREVITPTVAYQLTDRFSIGAGVAIGKSKVSNRWFSAGSGHKIEAKMEDDLNTSFNVGALYRGEEFSFGLTYRGRTDTDFKGDLRVKGIGKVSSLSLDYDHPEQVQAGVRYVPRSLPELSIEVDGTWTNWSINKNQTAFVSPSFHGFSELTVHRDWENTRQIRVGIEYKATENLALRCGYYDDPSPVPDTSLDYIWPDADKETWSAGLGYTFGAWTADMALTWARIPDARHITGESGSLDHSYLIVDPKTGKKYPATVDLDVDGDVYGASFTLTRRF